MKDIVLEHQKQELEKLLDNLLNQQKNIDAYRSCHNIRADLDLGQGMYTQLLEEIHNTQKEIRRLNIMDVLA